MRLYEEAMQSAIAKGPTNNLSKNYENVLIEMFMSK
jgi:hypothetical protein